MVSADTLRTVVGILGNVIALCLFLSPVATFVKIVKKGSVEEFSAVPYLATILNCMMWMVYGLPLVHPHSLLVITINGAGTLIELTYIVLYLIYSPPGARRVRVLIVFLAEVVFVALVFVLVLTLAHTHDRRSQVVGILCVLFGILMYLAPLSIMRMVFRTKSVEYMPPFLSLAALLNGVCWFAYALIKFDLYITIPNGIGIVFASAQLVLYAVYYKSTQKILAERRKKQGGTGLTEVVVLAAAAAGDTSENGTAAAAAGADDHRRHQPQRHPNGTHS